MQILGATVSRRVLRTADFRSYRVIHLSHFSMKALPGTHHARAYNDEYNNSNLSLLCLLLVLLLLLLQLCLRINCSVAGYFPGKRR